MIMAADKQDKVLNFSSEREQSGACSSSAEREKNQGKNFLNVPNLRFPEFKDEWDKDRVRNLFTMNVGGDIDKANVSSIQTDEFKYPVIANALSNDGIYGYTSEYKDDCPSITVTGRGDVGLAKYRDYPLFPIVRLLVLHSKGKIDCRFGVHAINCIKKYEESTGVPQLTAPQLGAYSISFPNLTEQAKIGAFLKLIDERISTQIRIIEDLKSERKYLLEQLFCLPNERVPKLRLKGMTGEWQKVKLCYIANRVTEKNKANTCNRVLTIAAQYGLIDQQEFFNKQIASSDLTTYYLLHKGDFAYNKSYSGDYSWGAVKRLDKYDKGVLSSLYICFRPNENVDSDFLCHYFESTKWYRGISEISGEGARNHGLLNMSVDDYFNTLHRIPSVEEQRQISSVLNTTTQKIEIEVSILDRLQQQKKYLLSTMFI